MPFNDLEKKRIENALDKFLAKRRPPLHIRKELDIGYTLTGQSVELLEIRPQWDDPSIIHRHPFAKATYVKVQDCWKIFWMRASLKWQGYEPTPAVASIDEFLAVVDRDQYGFWGVTILLSTVATVTKAYRLAEIGHQEPFAGKTCRAGSD